MRNYFVFVGKEITESIRTKRAFILLIIFFIFGVMNPLIAKLTPEIAKMALTEGINIEIPEPAAIDSWMQFFKNVSQMGIIVTLILFGSIVSKELSKGTLINVLTKGLSRNTVIISKYTVMLGLWTVSYAVCLGTTWGYTVYLWADDKVHNLWFALFGLWLVGVFLLSILMFAASLTKSSISCLLITGGAAAGLLLINIIPKISEANPLSLASAATALLKGEVEIDTLYTPIIVAAACSLALLAGSVLIFRKKQL